MPFITALYESSEATYLRKKRVIDAVASLLSSILINRQLVMLNMARQRVTRSTVHRERRGGRPAVRRTSREGVSTDTRVHNRRGKGGFSAPSGAGLWIEGCTSRGRGGRREARAGLDAHRGPGSSSRRGHAANTDSWRRRQEVSRRRRQPRRGRRRRPRRRLGPPPSATTTRSSPLPRMHVRRLLVASVSVLPPVALPD